MASKPNTSGNWRLDDVLKNRSFEQVTDDRPVGGQSSIWGGAKHSKISTRDALKVLRGGRNGLNAERATAEPLRLVRSCTSSWCCQLCSTVRPSSARTHSRSLPQYRGESASSPSVVHEATRGVSLAVQSLAERTASQSSVPQYTRATRFVASGGQKDRQSTLGGCKKAVVFHGRRVRPAIVLRIRRGTADILSIRVH